MKAAAKGLGQFLDDAQQRDWLDSGVNRFDGERPEQSFERRFHYAPRFEQLLRLPQAEDLFGILAAYGSTCLPVPRLTERFYWSVSCLASSPDKPLARVNASWMELFTLLPDGLGLRARVILHLSDFTTDGSPLSDHLDHALIERCAGRPEDVSTFLWKADTFGVKIRGANAIHHFLDDPPSARAIRRFNLTHMNRGRNAYQASHCYSLADIMLGE